MGSTTTQGRPTARVSAAGRVAFRSGYGVGALIANFRSSIPSPSFPLFTLHWRPHGFQCKTRGRADRYSFLVRLFHPQLHAGLSRRTPTSFSDESKYSNGQRRSLADLEHETRVGLTYCCWNQPHIKQQKGKQIADHQFSNTIRTQRREPRRPSASQSPEPKIDGALENGGRSGDTPSQQPTYAEAFAVAYCASLAPGRSTDGNQMETLEVESNYPSDDPGKRNEKE